jgi:hypothetical protein
VIEFFDKMQRYNFIPRRKPFEAFKVHRVKYADGDRSRKNTPPTPLAVSQPPHFLALGRVKPTHHAFIRFQNRRKSVRISEHNEYDEFATFLYTPLL